MRSSVTGQNMAVVQEIAIEVPDGKDDEFECKHRFTYVEEIIVSMARYDTDKTGQRF